MNGLYFMHRKNGGVYLKREGGDFIRLIVTQISGERHYRKACIHIDGINGLEEIALSQGISSHVTEGVTLEISTSLGLRDFYKELERRNSINPIKDIKLIMPVRLPGGIKFGHPKKSVIIKYYLDDSYKAELVKHHY